MIRGLKARPITPASVHGTGLQPSVRFHRVSWGVAPGWYGCGPLALIAASVLKCITGFSSLLKKPHAKSAKAAKKTFIRGAFASFAIFA